MKKIVIHQAGSFDQLKVEEHPDLMPKADEIKVKIHAIGINYADIIIRWGLYDSARLWAGPLRLALSFQVRWQKLVRMPWVLR